jgi:hypothetical protein
VVSISTKGHLGESHDRNHSNVLTLLLTGARFGHTIQPLSENPGLHNGVISLRLGRDGPAPPRPATYTRPHEMLVKSQITPAGRSRSVTQDKKRYCATARLRFDYLDSVGQVTLRAGTATHRQ